MPDFVKRGLQKVKKAAKISTSQNVTPSTSSLGSTEQTQGSIDKVDWALQIAYIVKEISEANQLLSPLKSACALIIRGLEATLVKVWLLLTNLKSNELDKERKAKRGRMD
ncbi:hypothetical protein M408DRAFT_164147 [Serendipita vermifera MAFF 305830]|uniref:Uncharacterized protein n=1 Tax=Serendipita vermifera MAFF 305830 TaxID=933852 RepID=A0A0C3B8G4_SERVB|nr:hypothetical protein M408DRAFT_164147 [Serendipita vermifera MAFF 305830]